MMKLGVVICTLSLFLFLGTTNSYAQSQPIASTASGVAERAAAKIIVVPYSKQDEDIRTVLDERPNVRIAVAKVKEAFDQRGWTTVDFVANLRSASASEAFTADRQSDLKSSLLTSSGADFYVIVDAHDNQSSNGTTSLTLSLTAFETHSGASFSNKTGTVRFQSVDFDRLITKALESVQEEFFNQLQEKTDEIRQIGRAIIIEFNLAEESEINFDEELSDGTYLSDEIEEWIHTNAFQGRYNLAGVVENKMVFDEVRIPLKDQVTDRPYNPNRFGTEIIRFLRSKGVETTRNITGQKLFITIR